MGNNQSVIGLREVYRIIMVMALAAFEHYVDPLQGADTLMVFGVTVSYITEPVIERVFNMFKN